LGSIEDIVFHVQGDFAVEPKYSLEVFFKTKLVDPRLGKPHVQLLNLTEDALRNLTKENFRNNTGLDFDINDPAALREFLAGVYFMRGSVRDLILISIDNSEAVSCQKWSLDLNFDFNQKADVLITKDLEHTDIDCTDEMRKKVHYKTVGEDEDPEDPEDPGEDRPVKASKPSEKDRSVKLQKNVDAAHQESFFFDCLFLLVNVAVAYYLGSALVLIGRYNALEKERITLKRWTAQRKEAEEFAVSRSLLVGGLHARSEKPQYKHFSVSSGLLLLSNLLLTLANLFSLFNHLGFRGLNFREYSGVLLGCGSGLAWANVISILSLLESFTVVSRSISNSAKSLLLILVGILPLFFAFLFAGYCAFHEHDRFDTLTKTNATLSAILAGDEIMDFIIAMTTYGEIGFIYAMGFCVVFIVCIHNVLLFVVTEAFKDESARYEQLKAQSRLAKGQADEDSDDQSEERERLGPLLGAAEEQLQQSVAADRLYRPRPLLEDEAEQEQAKSCVFDSVIPESRSSHMFEMNTRKQIIKEDIHFLKETVQNLLTERMDPDTKSHLLVSALLYNNFLVKRLNRILLAIREDREFAAPNRDFAAPNTDMH